MGKRFRANRFSWWDYQGYWTENPNGGVSGNSRIVPHRYQDDGDNGKAHRREIRRKEERLWRREAEEEM